MGRVAALDYGERRIGVALSDPTATLASPLTTLDTGKSHAETAKCIAELVGTHDVEKLVIGDPRHLSGKASAMSKQVEQLVAELEQRLSIPIVLWDERLTSAQVDRLMRESGVKRKKRASRVDELAATLILQSYLDTGIAPLPRAAANSQEKQPVPVARGREK